MLASAFLLSALAVVASATNILLTNDDGWAVAVVRAQYTALNNSGYDVVLSCPAQNESGTGSSTATPKKLTKPCEYNSCPTGSPAEGSDSANSKLNYVNAYPADSAKYGITTLSPKFFKSAPDFVVSGPNVGQNLGTTVNISGTVGAAVEAVRLGVPAVAFSGDSPLSQSSYTTLSSSPNSANSIASKLYASVTTKFLATLLNGSGPILPPDIFLNVNYPSASKCTKLSQYEFVLSRMLANSHAKDVNTCGSTMLPTETDVVGTGCYVSVSVANATNKGDVDAATQNVVLKKLGGLLTCIS